jgi:hypothetical protein
MVDRRRATSIGGLISTLAMNIVADQWRRRKECAPRGQQQAEIIRLDAGRLFSLIATQLPPPTIDRSKIVTRSSFVLVLPIIALLGNLDNEIA